MPPHIKCVRTLIDKINKPKENHYQLINAALKTSSNSAVLRCDSIIQRRGV